MATGSIVMKMSIFQKIRGPSEKYPFLFLLCQFKLFIKYLAIVVIITLLNQHGNFHINAYCKILLAVIF